MALTQKQLDERLDYIGASECAAALGLSPWKSQLQLWAEKSRQIPVEQVDTLQTWFGTEAEEIVAKRFCLETGKSVHRVNETLYHPKHSFLACHLDRKVEGERAILQCKTASAWSDEAWEGEEIPAPYILQEVQELAVSGYDRAYIACLIGNHRFAIKTIERDLSLEAEVIGKLVHFWQEFVIQKVMPHVSKSDADTLYKLFPVGEEEPEMELTDEANKLCESIAGLVADSKGIDAQIETSRNELRAMLKGSAIGKTDTYRVTWKNQITNRIETDRLKNDAPEVYAKYLKPSEGRVLRIGKIKVKKQEIK